MPFLSLGLVSYWFFGHSRFNRPPWSSQVVVHQTAKPPGPPEGLLRFLPIAEQNRQPGQTVFQWKCTVPARHALVFRLVQWSSNGVPTVLDTLSGYAVAGSGKSVEATFQWSLQDGARLSPDLEGQHRWDHSVRTGSSRVDGPPLWTPKEKPDWGWITPASEHRTHVRPGETVPLPMFTRAVPDAEARAVEAQVTLEPLGDGFSVGKDPRLGFGTNWLDALKKKSKPVAENPEPGRDPP